MALPPPPPGYEPVSDAAPSPAPEAPRPMPPPPPGYEPVDQGSPILKAAGQIASFPVRAGRALGVGLEDASPMPMPHEGAGGESMFPPTPAGTVEKETRAFQPGYQPRPGEKLGAAMGSLAGAVPEIAAASAVAPTFLPEAPMLGGLARVALARAAHSALVFGATAGYDTSAEQAALTGKIDPMSSFKAAAGGAVMGAGIGAAGAVPALVSGKLPEAVTKVLSDEIASRIFGASVAGAVGAGASAAGGGTKEDIAAHGAGFFLMDILGNANFDAAYKQAAKDSAIKPLVDDMVGSGMHPQDAVAQARGMLENVLKETGNASQVIRESSQYGEAVKFMTGEYLKANPGMDPVGAEALARRRLDIGFANGEMTIAELKKLKLSLSPAEAAPGGPGGPADSGPALPPAEPGPPVPDGSSEAPAGPTVAPQPGMGERVVVPQPGGFVEGKVIGYDHETGHPRVEVTGAHGETPPGEIGDVVTADPDHLHIESGATSGDRFSDSDPFRDNGLVGSASINHGKFSIKFEKDEHGQIQVVARDANGDVAGELGATGKRNGNPMGDVYVLKQHRRQGLATAMYDYAESKIGNKFVPSAVLTDDGDLFWRNRTKRSLSDEGVAEDRRFDTAAPETDLSPRPTGGSNVLPGAPANSIGQMTPDEFSKRFPGVPQAVYVKALMARLDAGYPIPPAAIEKHPELAEAAKEKEILARWKELEGAGVAGNEQPIADMIRRYGGGLNVEELGAQGGESGDLATKNLTRLGLARAGGGITGWDHLAEMAHEAGLIPERDVQTVKDALASELRKGTKSEIEASTPYEQNYGKDFEKTTAAPRAGWMPERTKAALDAAGVKNGGPVTSAGFLDADHGRIKRGEKGTLVASDLEHGRLLVDFGGKTVLADPRDIRETYKADREAVEAPPGGPQGVDVRRGVEAATGVTDPNDKIVELAESEVLRIKLLNQAKGSIVGAQAARREGIAQMSAALRAGKDIRKTLASFTRQALTDLKVNAVTVGKLMHAIAGAKNDHDFTQALLTIEDTVNAAYSKQLDAEIKKVWDRAQGSPGVEVGWQKAMREAYPHIRFTRPTAATVERAQAVSEFIAQAVQAGAGGQINPSLRAFAEDALKTPLADVSIQEKEEIRDTMLSLEKTGRQAQALKEHAQMYRRMRMISLMTATGQPADVADTTPRRPGDGPLSIQTRVRNSIGTETTFWQDKGRAILAPHVMRDMADGNRGYQGGHSEVGRMMDGAYHDASQFSYALKKPVHDIIEREKITPAEFEQTAIVLIRNQAGGLEHLMGDRWLGANEAARAKYVKSIVLDARQKKLAAALLAPGQDQALFKMIADDIRARQNREVKKVEGWFPFVNNYSRFGDMPLNERLGDVFENRFARKEVAHGYTIERQEGAKTALRYDLPAWEKVMDDIGYQIKAGSTMQLFSEAVNSMQYERRMGPFWTKWMRQYATLMASRGGTQGARRSEMIQKITRNMATYGLGWRIASAFSHVGLLPLGANEIGWGQISWGLQNYGKPKYAKFLRENVPEFRESTKGAAGLEGVRSSNQPASARGAAFNVYDSARRMFAGSTALGAYKHWFEQRGLPVDWKTPKREALLYAASIMTRTQGSPLYKDVPLALSSGGLSGNVDLDRAILQFHQPILARWSYFQHDIKALGWDTGDRAGAALKFANLMLGQALEFGVKQAWKGMVGAIVGGVFGVAYANRKESPMWQRFAEHVAGTIPFMDNLMSMGLHQRTGIPALDAIQAIPHGVVTAARAAQAGHHATALHATVEALSGIAAVAAGTPGGSIVAEIANKGITAFVNHNKRPTVPRPPRMPRP